MLLLHNTLVNQNADTNLHFFFHFDCENAYSLLSLWLNGPANNWKEDEVLEITLLCTITPLNDPFLVFLMSGRF